ncbi:MAG: hypothetical protein WA874_15475 [Chryseosolibacter sp.]
MMGNLEDIPKKQIYRVPDGYFENLPSRIQTRIAHEQAGARKQPVFRYSLRYALPLVIAAAVSFYYYNASKPDASSILATVETDDLITYIEESDVTTEDLLEFVEFNNEDLDSIENEVYDLDLSDTGEETLEFDLNTFSL